MGKSGSFTCKRRGCLDSTFIDTLLGMEWLILGSEHVGFSLNSVKRMSVKRRGRRDRRGAERGESRMLLSVVGFSYTLPSCSKCVSHVTALVGLESRVRLRQLGKCNEW